MNGKKIFGLLVTMLILSSIIAACAQPTPQVIEKEVIVKEEVPVTVVVEKEVIVKEKVVETVVVEKEVVVIATAEPKEPIILRTAGPADDLKSLDPHYATTTQDRNVVDMIFNGLVRYAPGKAPAIEPDLAEELPEPEIVGGKQVWTFRLRRGVMCHPSDGVPSYTLTAEDVVYSLQKSANPDRSAYAGAYEGMTFEALDDYTVKITLEAPVSKVLFFPKVADYSGGFIVCKKAIEAMGDEAFKTHPVGTGPFMFDSYHPQEKIMLVANDAYFRGRPLLDGVEYRYMSDFNSRVLALQAGELDFTEGTNEEEWIESIEKEGFRTDVFGPGEASSIHFNITVEPLNDPQVRKALAYATSRDDIVALGGAVANKPIYSFVPYPALDGGMSKAEVGSLGLLYELDRERAKQMLADAGYPDGFSLEVVTSPMGGYIDTIESLQAQWAEVGVDLKINNVDHSTFHAMIRDDVNPIVNYICWRPNADVYLTRFFHSNSIVVTGAKPDTNFSHYDQLDDLIEAARIEIDPDKQIELWKQAQIKLLEEMIAYPLRIGSDIFARSPAVDYGHELISTFALYPQITENTRIVR